MAQDNSGNLAPNLIAQPPAAGYRPAVATPSPAPTAAAPTSGGSSTATENSLDAAAGEFDSQNPGGASSTGTKNDNIVPMWRHKPKPETDKEKAARRRTGRGDPDNTDPTIADTAKAMSVDEATAKAMFLDMTRAERDDLRALMIRASVQGIDANSTDEDLLDAWAKWVGVAADYNRSKADSTQWISPWEALEKLGAEQIAQNGGRANAYIDRTRTTYDTFTWLDIAQQAGSILTQMLGRGPTEAEKAKYLNAVNTAAKEHPITEHTVGTRDKVTGGDDNVTVTRSGGMDAAQTAEAITEQARQNPEYAKVQAATTYFDAVMQALNSPAGM